MAPSKLRKAIGAVKDKTSIGLAKVSNSTSLSDLDVAIVKATRHDEFPADEKHIREILSLTCYSRAHVGACVATLSRRLGKTRNWTVALKTLFLIHRLLLEGDSTYEKEIFFTTRRGTRMLNLSDFRDTSRSDAFDFSAFVRTYALYLDERLDYRMHGRRKRRPSSTNLDHDQDGEADPSAAAATATGATAAASRVATPVRDMPTDRIFARTRHLQRMLERFLACRPTGAVKHNGIVAVALYPLVKESFKIYYDLVELMNIFVDRFMDLEIPECVSVHEIFHRLSKQFDELDLFYGWARTVGVCRTSEYPEIERITSKKLEVMEEFIRDKSALAIANRQRQEVAATNAEAATKPPEEEPEPEYEKNALKALPAPGAEDVEEAQQERAMAVIEDNSSLPVKTTKEAEEEDVDFLNLKGDSMTGEVHGDRLALALFDGPLADTAAPKWEAFKAEDSSDWETALVATATNLSEQRAVLGGGFDMLLLDGLYAQATAATATARQGHAGSSSSVVIPPPQPMLALPAPPGAASAAAASSDPFAASTVVPPPPYVQMSDMERKQHLLTEEQWMWERYAKEGMQGQAALDKLQQQQHGHGAYARLH